MVTVSSPMWPDIFLPGNTRPGSCAIEIEPGTLCERLLPCDARCELKLWRLMVPAKPLPIEVPCTSTIWPAANSVTGTVAPGLYWPATSAPTRNSRMISPASTPALARWPASGLVDAARPCASRTRPAGRRSRRSSSVLTWVTRLLDTSSTVTGTASPSSVKMRIMPTLRPSNPRRLLRLMLFSAPCLRCQCPTSIGQG